MFGVSQFLEMETTSFPVPVYLFVKLDWWPDSNTAKKFGFIVVRTLLPALSAPLQSVKFWGTKDNLDQQAVDLCRPNKDIGGENR